MSNRRGRMRSVVNVSHGVEALGRANAVPRSQNNRRTTVSMWSFQVNTQQRAKNGHSVDELKQRLAATMHTFFSSEELLGRALNFHWGGDGPERLEETHAEGTTEVGGTTGFVHAHFVVRITHDSNIGFANTHKEKTKKGTDHPGYRPEGQEVRRAPKSVCIHRPTNSWSATCWRTSGTTSTGGRRGSLR